MPNNTTILMIRHAEKPDSGTGLAIAGQERAQAYVIYFQNYVINSGLIKIDYLFSAADSLESCRPRLTIEPFANALGVQIDNRHPDKDFLKVKDNIMQNTKYSNSNLLICWHHGEILDLATAFGADAKTLPPASNWPVPPWPNDVFGWLLQICFDSNGNIDVTQTMCINQELMYNDYGKNPPLPDQG